jgi:hypothetical protein
LSLSLPSRETSPTHDARRDQNNAPSDNDPPFLVHVFPPVYDLFPLSVLENLGGKLEIRWAKDVSHLQSGRLLCGYLNRLCPIGQSRKHDHERTW